MPIQRPADAVKIFLLFCIPPPPHPIIAPRSRFSLSDLLFFSERCLLPAGGNAASFALSRAARCGLWAPAVAACAAMRLRGRPISPAAQYGLGAPAIAAGGFPAAAGNTPARRGYARKAWASPAGRPAAPPARYPRFFLFYGFRFVLKAAGGAERRFFVPRRPQFPARLMHSVWPSCRNARLHLRRILFCVDFLFLNFVRH